jgi:hypothetical protein
MYSFINCTGHQILLELRKEGEWLGHVDAYDMRHIQGYHKSLIVMNNQIHS